ncbi:MAG: DNA translocase FtsK [Erysipelotrichaceae bacterium]|nr:DNA translocase FtsK [Erysipelotrichaceae bacterium]
MARKKKKEELKPIEEAFDYGALITLIVAVVLIVFSIGRMGLFGIITSNAIAMLFGPYGFIILLTVLVLTFIKVFLSRKYKFNYWFYIGFVLLNIATILLGAYLLYSKENELSLSICIEPLKNIVNIAKSDANYMGGALGALLYYLSVMAFEKTGTIIVLVVLFTLAAIMIVPLGVYRTMINATKEQARKLQAARERAQEERRQYELQLQRERERKQQEEEERKLRLAEEMNALYEEKAPTPTKEVHEQTKIEYIKNESEFSKKYFIDDDLAPKKPVVQEENVAHEEEITDNNNSKVVKPRPRRNANYRLPPHSLLAAVSGKPSTINKTSAEVKGKKLIEVLNNFGIETELIDTHIGPSVTKFELRPDSNVKVSRINNISDNIKMELAAKDIRIEAPIPGRNAVGVEIPNAETVMVRMSELVKSVPEKFAKSPLAFTLGKDLLGQPVYCELNKMPHLLIAGATGSGKSVCINTIITSYLLRTNPDDVKMVLIDPKKVEFSPYHDVPHLLWPVITDTSLASTMLKKAVLIMEDRYDKFADVGVRDIKTFNELVKSHNENLKEGDTPMYKLPYIVIIIDELADLMAVAKKDVELSIQRLTQLSRACGMHLIVATQRPSTDVITGLIKSNIPSRISFAVSSSIDSRTILDSVGAEKLLGNGDMLYMPQGENAPIRIQGCYVTDKEIQNITDFCKKQADPEYDDSYFEIVRANEEGSFAFTGEGGNTKDPLYDEVVEYVRESQKASTSLLQRKFGIGYNRSARIIDQLEENGIIGHANGSKPREVFIKKEENS